MMEIKNRDIEIAERILLPVGCHFDEERRNFIQNLNSCDLLAVPGSGKTTALQAKLFCLSQQLPFDKKQGILVLSHTNNAVDEIKIKLRSECSLLFEAPNFIGTVQEFVDTFLAIPYYEMTYKKKVCTIDANAYEHEINYYVGKSKSKPVYCLKQKGYDYCSARFYLNDDGEKSVSKKEYPQIKEWECKQNEEKYHKELDVFIESTKNEVCANGILHYDDCYFLAKCYIHFFPVVKNILRMRFRYIFIDECQDLEKYQLDLLDSIFDSPQCSIQRIGDKNQSIYNYTKYNDSEKWSTRNVLTLRNSLRLTKTLANVVDPFTVDRAEDGNGNPQFVVIGKRQLKGNDIPPHLILFDENTKDYILPLFNRLINKYDLRDTTEGRKYGFHIIGWAVRNEQKSHKLRLADIFPSSIMTINRGTDSYETLSDFITFGPKTGGIADCKRVIIEVLIHILRMAKVKSPDSRYYTMSAMEAAIESSNICCIDDYRLFTHKASVLLYKKQYDDCYCLVKNCVEHRFSKVFKFDVSSGVIKNFVGDSYAYRQKGNVNAYPDIVISSVHSIKGQTHCATLYVETSYYGYESEHLIKEKRKATKTKDAVMYPNPLFQEIPEYKRNTEIATMRMMYVGFSRPTHMLCYAVHRSNWNDDRMINRMKELGWEILDLSENLGPG